MQVTLRLTQHICIVLLSFTIIISIGQLVHRIIRNIILTILLVMAALTMVIHLQAVHLLTQVMLILETISLVHSIKSATTGLPWASPVAQASRPIPASPVSPVSR